MISGDALGAIAGSNIWALGVMFSLLHGQVMWVFVLGLALVLATSSNRITREQGWHNNDIETVLEEGSARGGDGTRINPATNSTEKVDILNCLCLFTRALAYAGR